MFIIPLGLGRKLPRFPYMTLAITGLTLLFSVFSFSTVQKVESGVSTTTRSAMLESWFHFAEEVCTARKLGEDTCRQSQVYLEKIKEKDGGSAEPAASPKTPKAADMIAALQLANEATIWLVKGPPTDAAKTVSGRDFMAQFKRYKDENLINIRKAGLLSSGNLSLVTVIRAQLTHAGWMHLIGNLLFLIMFGFVVEQRIYMPEYLAVYLAGGTIGLLTEAATNPPHLFLIGASANIAAVMGLFFALYYERRMRLLVNVLLAYTRVVQVPILIFFPLLFIAADISGALGNLGPQPTGVAHLAHLGGFLVGLTYGLWLRHTEPLPETFAFPDELGLMKELRSSESLQAKFELAGQIISYNPDNGPALDELLAAASHASLIGTRLKPEQLKLIEDHLPERLNQLVQARNWPKLDSILNSMPPDVSPLNTCGELISEHIYSLFKRQVEGNQPWPAVFLAAAYMERHPNSRLSGELRSALQTMETRTSEVRLFARLHPNSPVAIWLGEDDVRASA